RLGPRLNAAGRLESPDIGLHLLTTNDKLEAMQLAMRLDGINQERQRLNAEWNEKIVERIEKEWDLDHEPFIVLADPAYPHGIVGIIAGKLKDRYRSPILLFSGPENPNDPWKASGRSPEGFHLNEALTACQDLLVGFGGHAQSAGCSALYENLPALKNALNQRIRDLGWERPADVVWLDDELPFHEATETLLQELDVLEPFGQHNPMPVFGLLQAKVVGRKVRGNTLLLRVDDGRTIREVTAWGQADRADELDGWIRLSYGLRRSNYRNNALETIADKLEGIPAPPPIRVETKKTFATITDRREENRIEIEEGCAVYGWETLTDEEQEHLREQQLTLLPLHEEVPDNLDRLVLVTPPFDEAHYQSMQRAAHRIMLFWKNREESNITPSLLQEGYRLLLERRERPLNEALGALESELGVPGLAVLRIFKEAGVVVEKGLEWHLLAPPDEEIPLERMKSYLEYRDAMPFRERALNQTNQKQPAAK
ncbi:MAG: DHHA1 domain-containing protein, partial [Bacteroidota bacterium]